MPKRTTKQVLESEVTRAARLIEIQKGVVERARARADQAIADRGKAVDTLSVLERALARANAALNAFTEGAED